MRPRRLAAVLTVFSIVASVGVGVGLATGTANSTAIGSPSRTEMRIQLPHISEGQALTLTLGLSERVYTFTGASFELNAPTNRSGLLVAVKDGTQTPVGLALLPRIDGVSFPEHDMDEQSTAIGLMFLSPGMAHFPVFTDGVLREVAYQSPRLRDVVQAMEEQWTAGGNPIAAPTVAVTSAVEQLIDDVNRRLEGLLAEDELNLDYQQSETTPTGPEPQGSTEEPAPSGTFDVNDIRLIAARTLTGGLPRNVACESELRRADPCGKDEVYVSSMQRELNENDAAAAQCASATLGIIRDDDGREGDATCVVARSWSAESKPAQFTAVNFVPRWLLVHNSGQDGWLPDALIVPKTWQLPSAVQLARVIAESNVRAPLSIAKALNIDIGPREDLLRYYQEVYASFQTNGLSEFSLTANPGEDLRFATFGVDFTDWESGGCTSLVAPGATGAASVDDVRVCASTVLTVLTEYVVPATKLLLDIKGGDLLKNQLRDSKFGKYGSPEVVVAAAQALLDLVVESLKACSAEANCSDNVFEQVARATAKVAVEAVAGTLPEGKDRLEKGAKAASEVTAQEAITVFMTGDLDGVNLESLAEDALLAGVSTALVATPPGKVLQAIEIGGAAGGMAASLAELISDGGSIDPVDRYTVSAAALASLPSAEQLETVGTTRRGQNSSVAIVLDVSGSMQGGRLLTAVAAVNALIGAIETNEELFGGQASVSVTTFNTESAPVLPLTRVGSVPRDWGVALQGGGGTFIRGGLQSAIDQLRNDPTTSRRILLLSDGEDSDARENAVNMLAGHNEDGVRDGRYDVLELGIPVDTVAFDFQSSQYANVLAQVARVSGGMFFPAPTDGQIAASFIKSQQVLTGEVVSEELVPLSENGSATVKTTIRPNEVGRLPQRLVLSVYASEKTTAIETVTPDGMPADPSRLRFTAGSPGLLVIDAPEQGIWTFTVRTSKESGGGGVKLSLADQSPIIRLAASTQGEAYFLITREGDGELASLATGPKTSVPLPEPARGPDLPASIVILCIFTMGAVAVWVKGQREGDADV